MNLNHLTAEEAQQLAEGSPDPGIDRLMHMNTCDTCQREVAFYKELFTAVKASPKPRFEFNVEELAMMALPRPSRPLPWIGAFAAFLSLLFIISIVAVYKEPLLQMLSGLSADWRYIIIIPSLTLLCIEAIAHWHDHNKKIRMIEFSGSALQQS